MALMKEFNRQNLKAFAADIDKAIKPIAKKYGVAFKAGSGRFSPDQFTKKLEFYISNGSNENAEDIKYKANLAYSELYGINLNESDYNKIFTSNGEKFRFVGINTRGRRFPLIAQNVRTGNYHKFTGYAVGSIKKSREYAK